MPVFDWSYGSQLESSSDPTSVVLKIVTQTVENMEILQFSPPALNVSYELDVKGPFMRCAQASSTEISIFETYQRSLAQGSIVEGQSIRTNATYNSSFGTTRNSFGFLVMSAFDVHPEAGLNCIFNCTEHNSTQLWVPDF